MKKTALSILLILSSAALFSCQAPGLTPLTPSNLRAQNTPPVQVQFYDTAKDAFRWAEIEAQRWDFSARLAQVEARSIDEQGRSFEWIYYFTSTRKDKALKVTSRHDVEEVRDNFFGGGFMGLSWRIDSNEALEKAKEKGLKTFPIQSMKLDSFLTWEIDSWDGYFRVDARTGAVSLR